MSCTIPKIGAHNGAVGRETVLQAQKESYDFSLT